MAAAFFNQLADPERARAISAGTRAGRDVDPKVREVMNEAGIDLGQPLSRQLNGCVAMAAGNLVTMDATTTSRSMPGSGPRIGRSGTRADRTWIACARSGTRSGAA